MKHPVVREPEGPYERGDVVPAHIPGRPEQLRVLDLVEQLDMEVSDTFGLRSGPQGLKMILYLLRSHFLGQVVTTSSAVAESGMSYGSAMRMIDRLRASDLVMIRPRTRSGRSFSLHPADELLRRWSLLSRQLQEHLASFVAESALSRPRGIATAHERIIGAPVVLDRRLDAGSSLRLLLHADPTFTAMNTLKRQVELILGTPISSRALSIDRLRLQILENARLASSRYDILACDLPWFGELAEQGVLRPLDDLIGKARTDLVDFYPDAIASSSYLGRSYGIPIVTTAEMLVYRTDVLDALQLEPPRTAADLIRALPLVNQPRERMWGVSWNAARGTPLGHSFMMMMAAFGRSVLRLPEGPDGYDAQVDRDWRPEPQFLSDEALETAEFMRELMDYSPPNILGMAWYDRAKTYARGEAVFAYSHSLLAPVFELNENCAAFGRTGYLPHPVGPRGRPITPLGGYALAIPANIEPSRVDAAWTAIRSLTSPEVMKLFAMNGNLACARLSVSRDAEVRAKSPMIDAIEDFHSRGCMRMWPRPPIPGISTLIEILGEEIHDMLLHRHRPRMVLARTQARIEAILGH